MLRNAQFALKRAKQSGTTQVYEPTQAQAVRRRFSIETELARRDRGGRARRSPIQPLIDLATGRVAGFEALARWQHDGEPIPPTEFIPVAEESGLIVPARPLGARHRRRRRCADWDRKTGTRLPINISVNLSPIQISRDDVAAAVSGALAASGIDGDRLTLELTESAIIQDPRARRRRRSKALKRFDVKIAMDDFGTGYTSLASLQTAADRHAQDRPQLRLRHARRPRHRPRSSTPSSRSPARSAWRRPPKGIETEELAEALTELGCTYGQGFHLFRAAAGRRRASLTGSTRSA